MTIGATIKYSTGTAFGSGLANDAVYDIGTGPLSLHQIGGYNPPGNADYFVMLFDAVGSSVNVGDPGFQQFAVPQGASFSWDPSLGGWDGLTFLSYAISTTPGVYTASTGASLFLYAQAIDQTP